MENMDISSLKEELYSIHSSTDGLAEIEKDSKIVDLKDVGDMLVKVQRQMEDLTKSKSLFGRITDNIPILGKLKKSAEKELALQQEITDYVTSTLSNFERKYEDLIAYLKTFEATKVGFSEDVVKLDQWIEKATAYEATLTNSVDKLALERLMTEAKSELKRKTDSLNTLIEPIIIAATQLTRNINTLTPILKNILYTELKTMVGVNSFRSAANMMITLKESIVEIQKLNVINTNEAIVDILNNTKTNLLTVKDHEEMDKLREKGRREIEKAVSEIKKAQADNAKFMNEQYEKLKSSGALRLEGSKSAGRLENLNRMDNDALDNEILLEAVSDSSSTSDSSSSSTQE